MRRVRALAALTALVALAPLAALSLAGCGLNSVPTAEENVNAKWAQVQSEFALHARAILGLPIDVTLRENPDAWASFALDLA